MATQEERQNILSGITPNTLLQLLEFYGAQQQAAPFIDIDRQKLMAKFAPSTGAGAALRSAYQAVDAGADPQDVIDNFLAQYDSGELDAAMADSGLTALTPDEAQEVVGAIGSSAIAKQKQSSSKPSQLDTLKDLGIPELGFLLPALQQSAPTPRQFTPQPQLQALQAKLQSEIENLTPKAKETFGLDEAKSLIKRGMGSGAQVNPAILKALDSSRKKDFTIGDIESIIAPIAGVGSKDFQKQQKDRLLRQFAATAGKSGDVAKLKKTKEELAKAKKTASEMEAFEREGQKVYEEEFRRLAAKAMMETPTQFDVMKALMMKASK